MSSFTPEDAFLGSVCSSRRRHEQLKRFEKQNVCVCVYVYVSIQTHANLGSTELHWNEAIFRSDESWEEKLLERRFLL